MFEGKKKYQGEVPDMKRKSHRATNVGNGPNTVSGSTVSNTELSEFFCPRRVPGRELREFLSAV